MILSKSGILHLQRRWWPRRRTQFAGQVGRKPCSQRLVARGLAEWHVPLREQRRFHFRPPVLTRDTMLAFLSRHFERAEKSSRGQAPKGGAWLPPFAFSSILSTAISLTLSCIVFCLNSSCASAVKFNTTKYSIVKQGTKGHVNHANIHSCIASRGVCSPFVANTPGLATHTKALTSDLAGDGTAVFDSEVSLTAEGYQSSPLASHSSEMPRNPAGRRRP
jgi:hypothetical protein